MTFSLKRKNFFFYLILYLSIIFYNKAEDDSNPIYRCGEDNFEPIPLSSENIAPLKNDGKKFKRLLDVDGFKDFDIYLDLLNFDENIIFKAIEIFLLQECKKL